jgi:fimbrial chaperone protein
MAPEKAPSMLTMSRSGKQVTIKNPTPYYVTMVQIKAGSQSLNSVMVPPMGQSDITLSGGNAESLHFRTMNDYGGTTDELTMRL